MEDLYTWPFKLTQNMVQKNNDKIKKTQIKSQHLLREKYDTSCEVGATERGCSGSIGSDDTRGYGAGSGDVGKELPRGMNP